MEKVTIVAEGNSEQVLPLGSDKDSPTMVKWVVALDEQFRDGMTSIVLELVQNSDGTVRYLYISNL